MKNGSSPIYKIENASYKQQPKTPHKVEVVASIDNEIPITQSNIPKPETQAILDHEKKVSYENSLEPKQSYNNKGDELQPNIKPVHIENITEMADLKQKELNTVERDSKIFSESDEEKQQENIKEQV